MQKQASSISRFLAFHVARWRATSSELQLFKDFHLKWNVTSTSESRIILAIKKIRKKHKVFILCTSWIRTIDHRLDLFEWLSPNRSNVWLLWSYYSVNSEQNKYVTYAITW